MRNNGRGFCPQRGKPHEPMADFCTGCGTAISSQALTAGSMSPESIATAAFSFTAQAPGNAIPEELTRRWSWGAFLLPFFWPFWNANVTLKWITVAAIVLGFVTGGLPGLALGIYFGIKGNSIAARDRQFSSVDQYVVVQRAWARWGVIILLASLVIGFGTFLVSIIFAAALSD